MKSIHRRVIAPLTTFTALVLALTGCAGSPQPGKVGKADGIVRIAGPITGKDATRLEQSWAAWESANHIRIVYSGSKNFEEQIGGLAQQGDAPDLAIFAEPGLVGDLATRGYLQKMPTSVASNIKANFPAAWAGYTTFNGSEYAAPLLATLNGWVFYSPKQFAAWGVTVPTSWPQLLRVTQQIQAKTGSAPWCEGFSADAASGGAGTDWIEDVVLRQAGKAVYDEWADHKIGFSDPRIKRAFDEVSKLLLNKDYVNASINTTSTADVAAALKSGTCAMTHQTSSFLNDLTGGAGSPETISPDGDIWAFMLPGPSSSGLTPVTEGGDFVAAFSNDADTVKVQKYLSSNQWANSRVALGGAISPASTISPGMSSSLLAQQSTVILQQFGRVSRFDASDLMPSIVGDGTFLTGMVDWVDGKSTNKVLVDIDSSWPTTN